MPYEKPSWFAESDLDENSRLRVYFDRIEELDPVRGYEERNTDWFAEHILPDFLAARERLQLGPTLLDAGCGFGYFTRRIAQHFQYVVGVDFSPERVAGAKKYNASPNIEYLVLDLATQRLERINGRPVPGKGHRAPFRLDSVVSSAVLQHVPPPRRMDVFTTISSAIKSGGHLILYDERSEDRPERWDGFYEAISAQWMRSMLADSWLLRNHEPVAVGMNGERIHRFELQSVC